MTSSALGEEGTRLGWYKHDSNEFRFSTVRTFHCLICSPVNSLTLEEFLLKNYSQNDSKVLTRHHHCQTLVLT